MTALMLPYALHPYSTYKPSGVFWIGDVPAHWEVRPGRAIFQEVIERDNPDEQLLSVTIVRGVIAQETLLQDSSQKDSSRLDKSAYKLVCPGDIVYNKMRAWQGAVGVSTLRGIVSPAYVVQRPRCGSEPLYFHHLMRLSAFATEAERWSYGIASDMWSLRPEHFKMIHFPLPPIDEQRAIVRYLDYVDDRIRRYVAAKERLIALLEEERQAVINRAVTRGLDPSVPLRPSGIDWLGDIPAHWDARRLRTVAEMRVSNVDKHTRDDEQPVRLCNYVDVYKNEHITSEMSLMDATATKYEIEKFRLHRDDVLITKDSETWDDIGVPAIVTEPADDLISGYHLALLRPYSIMSGRYLARVLQDKLISWQFHVEAKGVTRYGLSQGGIKSVNVPLPPLHEQTAIVEYLDKATADIDVAIDRARRQIDLLHEYRSRLIADVVTGKLDVREAASQLPNEAGETAPVDE